MSSSTYVSTLKNLKGAFKTKKQASSGGSEFAANPEDAAKSVAPQGTYVLVVGNVDNIIDIPDHTKKLVLKKRKSVAVKPPKGREPVLRR